MRFATSLRQRQYQLTVVLRGGFAWSRGTEGRLLVPATGISPGHKRAQQQRGEAIDNKERKGQNHKAQRNGMCR